MEEGEKFPTPRPKPNTVWGWVDSEVRYGKGGPHCRTPLVLPFDVLRIDYTVKMPHDSPARALIMMVHST